jgi:abortive infection bacteriophage resistance protein
MNEKPFKSYEEQIEILKFRGMNVNNQYTNIRNILEKENYYNIINGYKDLFIQVRASQSNNERYKANTQFSEVYSLYKFDRELRSIFLKKILIIETNIKSIISYNFSKKYGINNYLITENFNLKESRYVTISQRYQEVIRLIATIQNTISTQIKKKNQSIGHYISNFGYIPLWVLMNILTFGTVSLFYKNMKQTDKQDIAKIYNISSEVELGLMLKILTLVRNICAHDERLYNFKSKDNIRNNIIHSYFNSGSNSFGKNDLFAVLICAKILLEKDSFKNMVNEIENQIDILKKELKVITTNDVLNKMGFPTNWKNIVIL